MAAVGKSVYFLRGTREKVPVQAWTSRYNHRPLTRTSANLDIKGPANQDSTFSFTKLSNKTALQYYPVVNQWHTYFSAKDNVFDEWRRAREHSIPGWIFMAIHLHKFSQCIEFLGEAVLCIRLRLIVWRWGNECANTKYAEFTCAYKFPFRGILANTQLNGRFVSSGYRWGGRSTVQSVYKIHKEW